MPEVSLVAILDADKEGFLRSERSLIQTIGRAARNLNGKAILYADRVTGSMQRAMDESQRRRQIQLDYNQQHGITPQSIQKAVQDIIQTDEGAPAPDQAQRLAEDGLEYASLTPTQLSKELKKLEKKMLAHAQDLEFEQAAAVRDQIEHIRHAFMGVKE